MNRTEPFLFLMMSLVVAACGDDAGGGGDDDPGPGPDAAAEVDAPEAPLACSSAALCTTYEVKQFTGAVPAAAGGEIASGLYRLAYTLIPDDVDEPAGYGDDLDVLLVRGASYNWAGFFRDSIGTVTTSGTTATFRDTRSCLRGSDGEPSSRVEDWPYTATGDELHLYSRVRRSDGVEWDKVWVYVRVDDPAEVCRAVASEPSSPGDSARCNVANCACSFTLDGTVEECT